MSTETVRRDPDVQTHWRPGQRARWQLAHEVDHPALGLRFEQLSETIQHLHRGVAWSPDVASQYALGAHGVLSREIGRMASMRASWSPKARYFVAMLMTEVPSQPVPMREFAESYDEFRWDRKWGWGSGPAGLRRLAEVTAERPLRDADLVLGAQEWRLASKFDYAPLNRAWSRALSLGDVKKGFIPLLPVVACSCFATSRRWLLLEADENERVVDVPSLWELFAAALALGSERLRIIGQRFLTLEAQRSAGTRGENRRKPAMSAKTIEAAHGYLNGLLDSLATVAKGLSALEGWTDNPRLELVDGIVEDNPESTEDRTAVPLHVYRFNRQRLRADVEASRDQGHRSRAAGSGLTRIRFTTNLRRCAHAHLLGDLSCRPNEGMRVKVKEVEEEHNFGDFKAPGVYVKCSRKGKRPVGPHWRPISRETYELLMEWVEWLGLGADDYLWPMGDAGNVYTSADLASDFRESRVIAGPDNTSYCPVRIRHLVKQLAMGVGHEWISAHPGFQERISAKVFENAAGGNRMGDDELGYLDLHANRELWAGRAAVGDPLLGIPGFIDLLTTDAGARKGWDIGAIRQAALSLQAEHQRLAHATQRLQEAERERQTRELLASPEALKSASHRVVSERGVAFDIAKDRVDRAARECAVATLRVKDAEDALDALKTRGRTLPLPDSDSPGSLAPGMTTPELEREAWDDALRRAHVREGETEAPVGESELRRESPHLNLQELAGVLGVCDRTVRVWCDQANAEWSPLALAGVLDCLVVVSRRQRCIAVHRLPPTILNRLLPEQHELIDQLLMVPMGSTRWKGPSIDPARIQAADRPQQN